MNIFRLKKLEKVKKKKNRENTLGGGELMSTSPDYRDLDIFCEHNLHQSLLEK